MQGFSNRVKHTTCVTLDLTRWYVPCCFKPVLLALRCQMVPKSHYLRVDHSWTAQHKVAVTWQNAKIYILLLLLLLLLFRQPTSPGEILNCDLTEANGTSLDPNNLNHFIESSLTDFYVRFNVRKPVKDGGRLFRHFTTTSKVRRRQLEAEDEEETREICKRFFSAWDS